jgi:hypothetical protein
LLKAENTLANIFYLRVANLTRGLIEYRKEIINDEV